MIDSTPDRGTTVGGTIRVLTPAATTSAG